MHSKYDVNITLTNEEAIVLMEFIARVSRKESLFEDQAEQRVLWDIECIAEKQLTEVFSPDYREIAAEARNRVRDKGREDHISDL